ncbi:MAG: hypothetical protein ACREXX_08850 [Gammaproteobacteria bacterium]
MVEVALQMRVLPPAFVLAPIPIPIVVAAPIMAAPAVMAAIVTMRVAPATLAVIVAAPIAPSLILDAIVRDPVETAVAAAIQPAKKPVLARSALLAALWPPSQPCGRPPWSLRPAMLAAFVAVA